MRRLQASTIVIVGLGLIGGSLARALRASMPGIRIVAVGRNEQTLQRALDDGSISAWSTDLREACREADMVVLAVPVLSVAEQLRALVDVLRPDMVITDVASVKQAVVDVAREVLGPLPAGFVPGHPIAGSEQSGYQAATPSLFVNRKVILTPLEESSADAVSLVRQMWECTGAEVLEMELVRHDEVLAATSHLPHLLAYALVDTLSQQGASDEIFRYAAGGFRDFTRIASSDPVMWRDIFMTNGPATVAILDLYMEDLQRLRKALLASDAELLHTTFQRAKQSRDRYLQQLQDKASAQQPVPERP
ncbi:MAG TPA: prephenate dehydrogenase/arogenate dehydrogenase family protein [Pseudomonadaceae bacterium]|nr:prephenate dehydrogenase/arogenate dehydrogenase family protein [Pseudomonadaceae bacterium]